MHVEAMNEWLTGHGSDRGGREANLIWIVTWQHPFHFVQYAVLGLMPFGGVIVSQGHGGRAPSCGEKPNWFPPLNQPFPDCGGPTLCEQQ